ncbi:MAG: ATP-dependent metallopeptidase FtsH/Yme1/Tma family protein [Acidobacteria bacterium]|nr:ATP-dependent metallopeptidase FtsH/Yme1/Tma family protein [Acidobacteriota bacterium]
MPERQSPPWPVIVAYLAAAGLIVYFAATNTSSATKAVTYSEFFEEVRNGNVETVRITADNLVGTLITSADQPAALSISTARLPNMDDAALLEELRAQKITIVATPASNNWWSGILVFWLPILLIFVLFSFLSRGRAPQGTIQSVGKSRAKIYDEYTQSNVTFADVAGVEEAEAELIEVVDFLKNPQKYTRLGGRIPKGVLLVGPPGTGKTLLAKAVAGEARVPFFSISGSEFMEIFVGVGAARVRDLFEQAKKRAPCIIFIDELDAIGKSRAAGRGVLFSNDEREQTLNQLLAEMDGFDTSAGVILMAATNTPEVLDQALLRAGRFDRQVVVDRPDIDGREAILKVHTRTIKLAPDANLRMIASRTPGMVGADLANIINEAALLAARRQGEQVEMFDIEEAIDRVMLGLEKKNRVMSTTEKERVAFHEAGHALVALSVEHANPVHRVSIIPRSIGALGHTLQLPTEERFLMTRTELLDQLTVMLGGRAAEEITFAGEISTGASDDLERASELARQMVTRFGMSGRMGNLTYGRPLAGRFLQSPFAGEERNYSDRTAEAIDEEVHALVDECYERSRKILLSRRPQLESIAAELINRETLDRDALQRLITSSSSNSPEVSGARTRQG